MAHARALALTGDEWSTLLGPTTADSFAYLLKTAIEVPALLEEAKSFRERGHGDSQTMELTRALLRKFHILEAWRAQKNSAYWAVPSVLENPADDEYEDKLFPFVLKFHSLTLAVEWILASTIMLQILDAILRLEELRRPLSPKDALQVEADKIARLLCQCFEYCYAIENGTLGAQVTSATQWAVRSYFEHRGRGREIEWCENISGMRGASYCRLEMMAVGEDQEHRHH